MSKQMKGITVCGDCAYYSMKKHKCTRGCTDEGTAQDHFYVDCPLPDVSPVEWVSVEDRLPAEMEDKSPYSGWSDDVRPSNDVLVFLRHEKRQTVAWYSYSSRNWTTVDECHAYETSAISHWAALPQPPKEAAK